MPSGEIERGLAESKRATELDPRSVIDASNYASMLMIAGRNADAIAACKPTLEYAPDSILCYPIIGMAYLVDGNLDEARRYYHLFVAKWSPQASGQVDAVFDALAGHGDRHAIAVKLSEATIEQWNDPNSGMPFTEPRHSADAGAARRERAGVPLHRATGTQHIRHAGLDPADAGDGSGALRPALSGAAEEGRAEGSARGQAVQGEAVMSFIDQLKRRKLVQWAVAYAAAAFALLQGIDIVAQQFGWPEGIRRGITLALVLGFFVTLVLAWYHGERGAQKVSGPELLLLALLLAIGGGLLWKFAPGPAATSAAGASTADIADRRSIAVLPFVNMSGDRNNEYFSDGVSEEILNVLAEIPALKVAARTSSFSFRDSKEEVPQIARQLGVRMVLEGSVRKQGDRVRITAQLIDAKTGFHVFSQTYDRELKDIFAIQDEIAKAIGNELEVKLAGAAGAGKNSVGTTDLKAYDLYLQGIALWQTRTEDNLWKAVDLFKQAVAADPKFAQAWGGLALVYAVIPDYSARISYHDAGVNSTDAAERALVLDPSLPEPYAALSTPSGWERRRGTTAALLKRAIALRPSFATAYQWLGTELLAAGDPEAGLAALDKAVELDPRSLVTAENRAFVLMALGRNTDAIAACDRVLAFEPDYISCQNRKGLAEVLRGNPEASRPYFARLAELLDPTALPLVNAVIDALQGRGDRPALAKKLAGFSMRSSLERGSGNVFSPADTTALLVLLGAPDLALGYLEKSLETPGNDPTDWTMMLPVLDPIRCEPRFKALVVRLNSHDPRADAVCKGKH